VTYGQRGENPGEGEPQEGIGHPERLTANRRATDFQGEQGPEGEAPSFRFCQGEERWRQHQEGSGRRETMRLLGRERP